MNITSIPGGKTAFTYYANRKPSEQFQPPSAVATNTPGTVQISEEAKQLYQKNSQSAIAVSASFDLQNPPLEAFAIPDWLGQYLPPVNNLRSGLDYNGAEALEADRFRQKYRNELQEYGELVNRAETKAMEINGLTGEFAYYTKVTLDQTVSSEKVHQDFRDNLLNSPWAIELMKMLGVDDALIEGLSTKS